jgi:hypothetical protein
MDEIIKLQNLNVNHSINEGLEILFFHVLAETKSKYGFYMMRYPPDKEWFIPELYFDSHETKIINNSIILHSDAINKYQIVKNLSFINEKTIDSNLKCFTIPGVLLHPNIQIILVFVNFDETQSELLLKPIIDKYIPMLCIQFLKKYIDSLTNESNTSLIRTIGKMKSPINEIIMMSNKDTKRSALSLAMIINDLIDLHKLKRNRLKLTRSEVKIREIFAELTDVVEFKFSIDDDVPEILYIDAKRLKQILLNFINNDSFVYISASMVIDINDVTDDNSEILCWEIEFNIDNSETVVDERLFISKKLISLMGGYFVDENDTVKFTIEACKDINSYSDNSLKKIKGRKILIVDNHEERRIDIGHRLQKWDIDISFASTETEGSLYLDESKNKIDLFMVGIPTFIDKILRFNIHKPYLQILDMNDHGSSSKNEYLTVKDITPINSPRSRKSSVTKPVFLIYPIEDIKLLSTIIEVLN